MTGKKGHSGGRRPDAGRPATRFTLEQGRRVLIHHKWPDGCEPGQLATVQLSGNGKNRTLILELEDTSKIIITL